MPNAIKNSLIILRNKSLRNTLLVFFILVNADSFAQNWNYYFGSVERNSLANNLKTASLTYSSSTSTTSVSTMVGDVRPSYGRGDIVIDGDLNVTYDNASTVTTLNLSSVEDIWINGDIAASVGKLNLVFTVPLGKKIVINGNINTNGGDITVSNNRQVHFQKPSGTQTINTGGGALNLGTSTLWVLNPNTAGSLVFNTGAGAVTIGGEINREYSFYHSPTRLLEWGEKHSTNPYEKSYTGFSIVSGRTYSARLYFWDSWDGAAEIGKIYVDSESQTYFSVSRTNGIAGSFGTPSTNFGTQYVTSGVSQMGGNTANNDWWLDAYVDIVFTAQHSGTLKTKTSLNQDITDESLELYNVWETALQSSNYNFAARTIEFNTTNSNITISASINNEFNLKKSGSGTLTLTQNNPYTGTTTIDNGTLVLQNDAPNPSNKSFSGTGQLRIEPAGTSFSSAFSTSGWTFNSTLTGLTLGKSGNVANLTFANATSIAGPIRAYGGTINVNANLSSTLSGALILLEGLKVIQTAATTVQTNAGNITYTATNTPWTAGSDYSILIGAIGGSTAVINAQGGNISLAGTFATSGITNTGSNADVAMSLSNTTIRTSSTGTISMNGNAYENASTDGLYIWGVDFVATNLIQTQSGNISITGTPGKNRTNGRGVIANNSSLKVLSASGTIQITDAMPAGHVLTNYTGAYFRPAATNAIRFGADGSEVLSSTSNIIFDVNFITFDVSPSILTSTGTLTIRPVASSFIGASSTSNLTMPSTLTSFTFGKTGNTADLTVSTAISINGPITLHGADLTLTGGLTTTNTSTGNITFNGTKLLGAGAIALATGRSVTANLSGNGEYTGDITGTTISLTKTGAGTLTLNPTNTLTFSTVTVTTGGLTIAAFKKLTLTGTLTNNATFTLKDNATFVQATTGMSMTGTGTYVVEKALAGNAATWTTANTSRFWYMGVPMNSVARSSFGNYDLNTNRLFSYSESTKAYTNITDNAALLSAGKGYVHRRSTDGTLTFTASNATLNNGLCNSDYNTGTLTRTSGSSVGFNLISNPYMAYLDWDAVTKTNVESTYYIRSNNTGSDISALITYNGSNQQLTHNTSLTLTAAQMQYIAPLQSIWVRVGTTASTGSLAMTRSMLSHQTGNPGLKTSTIFPTLARVNLVDGPRFDQMLVFMNQDMSNGVDQYDSEKMFVSGAPQLYTMAAGKKLVMNGLNSNKKKISVPLYLELPESKVYNLQLAEYQLEAGLILLEDKQEGTIQDFTIHDTYAFYANSGVLQNRFVLHFYMPDATITAQGPSNSWVAEEGSYTEGGSVQISTDSKGKVQISLDQAETEKVEGTIVVTDASGKQVHSSRLQEKLTIFELNLPTGVYYLTVNCGNLREMKKVFIQD